MSYCDEYTESDCANDFAHLDVGSNDSLEENYAELERYKESADNQTESLNFPGNYVESDDPTDWGFTDALDSPDPDYYSAKSDFWQTAAADDDYDSECETSNTGPTPLSPASINVKQYRNHPKNSFLFANGGIGKAYCKTSEMSKAEQAFEMAKQYPSYDKIERNLPRVKKMKPQKSYQIDQDHTITHGTKPFPDEHGVTHKYDVAFRREGQDIFMKRGDTEPSKSGYALIGNERDVERMIQKGHEHNKQANADYRQGHQSCGKQQEAYGCGSGHFGSRRGC